ncbi:MAG: hypothetical protein HRU76_12695 [Phycisphaeraceae bacterium]|nr:hypothetical protein [Phycisphaerales bacterium]QOJ18394.1 MAG: hypothetical protein HRU76_12695 [Phycisphaeraceae bacterium]
MARLDRTRRYLWNATLVGCLLAVGLLGGVHARADVIVLRDGRTLYGEVVSETDKTVAFRHQIDGVWTTQTIDRSSIKALYPQEGDQSDGAGKPGGGGSDPSGAPASAPRPTPQRSPMAAPGQRRPGAPLVAVIPLHGQVGGLMDGSTAGTFDAMLLEGCLEEAEKQGASLVVLDIRSPGGLVSDMEAISELILDWNDRLRLVAWPDEAFSAAAIITLCCRDIIVRPTSLIGAATIVTRDREGGLSALDAKMASPHYARQRQYMERAGRPYAVVAAMTIQEAALWWSPVEGFVTETPRDSTGWTAVDSPSTILTMTGSDAVTWGLAAGSANKLEDVVALCGIADDYDVLDLTEFSNRQNQAADRRLNDVQSQFDAYFRSLAALNQKMIGLFEARQRGDARSVDSLRKDVGREIGKVRNAGRQIERAARAGASRNITVPREYVSQIERDQDLLSQVPALLRSDSASDWSQAGQKVGTVLREWQKIVGQ